MAIFTASLTDQSSMSTHKFAKQGIVMSTCSHPETHSTHVTTAVRANPNLLEMATRMFLCMYAGKYADMYICIYVRAKCTTSIFT